MVAADAQRNRVRRRLLFEELQAVEWRAVMRSRHYLTASCSDTPLQLAWTTLYTHGADLNFLNKTILTKCVTLPQVALCWLTANVCWMLMTLVQVSV